MAAYLLAVCNVTNPNENFKKYIGLSGAMIEKHGGEVPGARAGQSRSSRASCWKARL